MSSVSCSVEVDAQGWRVFAHAKSMLPFRRNIAIPYAQWAAKGVHVSALAAAALNEMLESRSIHIGVDGHLSSLSHEMVAKLSGPEAHSLGFPPPVPFQLDIQSKGTVGEENFSISWTFIDAGTRLIAQVLGSSVDIRGSKYRIPDPYFQIIELANLVNSAVSRDEKLSATAKFRSALPMQPTSSVTGDKFIFSVRIAHASLFGLNVKLKNGEITFDPIPLGRSEDQIEQRDDSNPIYILAPVHADKFADDFRKDSKSRSTYAVESRLYLYLDPDLRPALEIVKRKQGASTAERLEFVMSPTRVLKRELGIADNDEASNEKIDGIFVETIEYSDRIITIGEWQPPKLPGIETTPNNWLPEVFSIVLGNKLVTGSPDDISKWLQTISAAKASGAKEAQINGIDVPVSEGVIKTLQSLMPTETLPHDPDEQEGGEDGSSRRRTIVYQTKENFEAGNYTKTLKPRNARSLPFPMLRSTLRQHQQDGLRWLIECYSAGWPGVLLADDMGLGKTIQSLAFLVWLKQHGFLRESRPALIVAPTSLLRNWEHEHETHLVPPGLGRKLVAYGSELKALRIGDGKEYEAGSQFLDTDRMRGAGWILTTYETLRDYQFSFSNIHFSCVILDEAQKVKNPASRTASVFKSITADFSIAMTGTPVENSIADLWSICDIVAPGMMPSLSDFVKQYKVSDSSSLESLSKKLLERTNVGNDSEVPPFALRRMKSDIAADLPKKNDQSMLQVEDMRGLQAEKYSAVDAVAQTGRVPMLRCLHDFRSVSLHPIDPTVVDGDFSDEEYISNSARLRTAFSLLEKIRRGNEKVLIFVHSKKIQNVLAVLIARRFKCAAPRIIRGDVNSYTRQEIVDEFSKISGFAALILSPRAAGVGLNITAANHVIHLDRWWNPAVEDQCTDRAYRIGQKKDVWVYALAARHPIFGERSYDLVLHSILERKRQLSRFVFAPMDLQPGEFWNLVRTSSSQSVPNGDFVYEIDKMTPTQFEDWVKAVLVQSGFRAAATPISGDGGADIVVRDDFGAITHLVQCKHTSRIESDLDSGLASDILRVRKAWKCPTAKVFGISNANSASPSVLRAASLENATLILRSDLANIANILSK